MHDAMREQEKDLFVSINTNKWISRRKFLVMAVAGLVVGCSSSASPQPVVHVPTPTPSLSLALVPGTLIAPANADRIKQLATLNMNSGRVRGLAWSQDSKTLAVGAMENIQLWDVIASRQIATLAGHNGQVYQLAWSPDGQLLASGADDNTVRIWDAQSRSTLHVLQGAASVVFSLAWSPDGKRLAAGSDTDKVQVWERATWAKPALWNGPATPGQYHAGSFREGVYGVAWSSDNQRLAGATMAMCASGTPTLASSYALLCLAISPME